MYSSFPIQAFVLAAIVVLYAAFDLFNKKNVPDVFAYAGVAVGIAMTLLYNYSVWQLSFAIAAFVGLLGYAVYRLGLWGAGDYFELVTISLILPLQPAPLLTGVDQLALPFVLSVFVATGLIAVLVMPIYYLFFTRGTGKERKPNFARVMYALSILALYIALLLATDYLYGFSLERFVIVFLLAVSSMAAIMFRDEIAARMVVMLYPWQMEEGDMIALSMMSRSERRFFARRYGGFGGLATRKMISELRSSKRKVPVYRNAIPLAFFMLMGVVVSLLLGDLLLLVV